jgi:hypothetical protein
MLPRRCWGRCSLRSSPRTRGPIRRDFPVEFPWPIASLSIDFGGYGSLRSQGRRHSSSFPRRDSSPGFCKTLSLLMRRGRRECRCYDAPAASCVKRKTHELVTTGSPNIPAFPARWFYGFLRGLPGDRAFLPPSPRNAKHCRELIPASRYQDATTSPSACTRVRLVAPQASIASRANVRDDAQRPSLRARDGRACRDDLPVAASEDACDTMARRANQLATPR